MKLEFNPLVMQFQLVEDQARALQIFDERGLYEAANVEDALQEIALNALSLLSRTGTSGGGTWGTITGTLSDQADLQAALDAKQDDLTFPLSPALGGTGINNGTNTLTVPATGTAALLGTANVFTNDQYLISGKVMIFQDISDTRAMTMGIRYNSAGSSATYIGFTPNVTNQKAGFELYPNGNGNLSLILIYGAGTPNSSNYDRLVVSKSKNAGVVFEQQASGVGYGTGNYHFRAISTVTNAPINIVDLVARVSTSGIGGGNGFGAELSFTAETATDGTSQTQGNISTTWIDATNATRKAKLSLSAYDTAARLGIEIEASGSAAMLGFFGVAPVVRPTALTTQLTTITHTAPGTPDYAIQDLVDSSGGAAFGFATKDEGNTVLSVIANLQTRLSEVETKLQALGLLT